MIRLNADLDMSNWKGTLQSCLVSITAIFDTQISSAILNGHLMLSLHPAVETLSSSSTCILQILCVVSNRSCVSFPVTKPTLQIIKKRLNKLLANKNLQVFCSFICVNTMMNSQFYISFQHITIAYSIIYSHTKT